MSQHVTDVLEGTRWVFGVRGAKYDMAKIWPTDIHDDHVKNIAFLMDKAGRWSLAPAFDVTYSYNPTGDWTARHQMPMNGKRDGFTLADFRACGKSALMKRGRAEAIGRGSSRRRGEMARVRRAGASDE